MPRNLKFILLGAAVLAAVLLATLLPRPCYITTRETTDLLVVLDPDRASTYAPVRAGTKVRVHGARWVSRRPETPSHRADCYIEVSIPGYPRGWISYQALQNDDAIEIVHRYLK